MAGGAPADRLYGNAGDDAELIGRAGDRSRLPSPARPPSGPVRHLRLVVGRENVRTSFEVWLADYDVTRYQARLGSEIQIDSRTSNVEQGMSNCERTAA